MSVWLVVKVYNALLSNLNACIKVLQKLWDKCHNNTHCQHQHLHGLLCAGQGDQDKQHIALQSSVHWGPTIHLHASVWMCQHPTKKVNLGFSQRSYILTMFQTPLFCELDTKCKRHLVNSKWLDDKKLNLNTFIREAPAQFEWTKDSWFSLSQRVHFGVYSVCGLLSADGGFWLQTLILPSSACLQLFKVPVGLCHDLAFNSPLDPVPWHRHPAPALCCSGCFFPSGRGLCNKGDTVMSPRSSWKRHKGALVGLFISRLVKT